MRKPRSKPRTTLGVLLAAGALVVSSASVSLADDHDAGVDCFVGDDWAIFVEPGDEVTCEAWGLTPEEAFEWEVEFLDLETDDLIDDDGAADGLADSDGVGEFSFTVPADITTFAFYEGWVTQDPDYEEPFFGLILVLNDVVCAPDPVEAGNEVACEVHGLDPGEWFYWAAELSDGFDDLDDLDFELEDLQDLDLDSFEDLFGLADEDLGDPHAEGEGQAGDDGVGHFSFDVPEDTDAVEYLTVVFAENSFGFYIGGIDPAAEEVEAPVVDEDDDDDPVVVERPTRVDTGAGGTATGANAALGALLLLGLTGALFLRRRVGES